MHQMHMDATPDRRSGMALFVWVRDMEKRRFMRVLNNKDIQGHILSGSLWGFMASGLFKTVRPVLS